MYDFGISGTKRTVRNRGVRKERLDCSYLGIPEIVMEIMAYPKSWTGPCTLGSGHWTLDSGPWTLDLLNLSPPPPKKKKIWTRESPSPRKYSPSATFLKHISLCIISD